MFCLESQKITKAQSLQNCGTQLKQKNGAMTLSIVTYLLHSAYMTLSMTMLCYYAECPYAECHYAECHFAECHYAACHYAELSVILLCVILLSVILLSVIMLSVIILRVIMLSVIMLSVIMLSVIMLSVIMLSVVVPKNIYWFTDHIQVYILKGQFKKDVSQFQLREIKLVFSQSIQNANLKLLQYFLKLWKRVYIIWKNKLAEAEALFS